MDRPTRPSALAAAKRRVRRRRREAGATMFIVAMTLAVLASVGIYALAAASSEVRTSGNARQSTQTHYLSQYGIVVASEELAATRAQLYLGVMLANPDKNCTSLQTVPAFGTAGVDPMVTACRRMGAQEFHDSSGVWLAQPTLAYSGKVPFDPSATTPGSLGPTPLKGDFYVEFTAPTSTKAASGYGLSSQACFIQFTAMSVGLTQPQLITGSGSSAAANTYFQGEGVETQTARLVAGPITPCPW
jgi:hypothetical protein